MGKVIIVEKNREGKIELTKDELQKMLDDAYNQGYSDASTFKPYTITYPSYKEWYTTITCSSDNSNGVCSKL